MADVFIVDSYEKQLLINNLLPDIFVLERKNLKGTRVSFFYSPFLVAHEQRSI